MSKVTIYTLAEELHMTPSMVSRALSPNGRISEEKRRLVLEAAKKHHFSPNRLASRLSMSPVRIGILINSRFQVNTDIMIEGIRETHERLKDYKIQYEVTCLNPTESNEEDIRRTLDTYRSYDGIILTGMSAAKYTPLLNELASENPNVVQVQAVNHHAKCLFTSQHHAGTASAMAAEFLSACLCRSERKNILLFTGDLGSALHADAAAAFEKSCAAMGLSLLSIVDMQDDEDYLTAILPDVFAQYGETLDGIYITSGLSGPLCRYLESRQGPAIPLVAFDTYADIMSYMEKGIITATISQNVRQQMSLAFERLVRHLISGLTCHGTVYTDIQLVLKSNMYQFG